MKVEKMDVMAFTITGAERLDPVRVMIETYSNPGETVLDFTMGSGTAGVACKESGRSFIGIEKDRDIYQVACVRTGYRNLAVSAA